MSFMSKRNNRFIMAVFVYLLILCSVWYAPITFSNQLIALLQFYTVTTDFARWKWHLNQTKSSTHCNNIFVVKDYWMNMYRDGQIYTIHLLSDTTIKYFWFVIINYRRTFLDTILVAHWKCCFVYVYVFKKLNIKNQWITRNLKVFSNCRILKKSI